MRKYFWIFLSGVTFVTLAFRPRLFQPHAGCKDAFSKEGFQCKEIEEMSHQNLFDTGTQKELLDLRAQWFKSISYFSELIFSRPFFSTFSDLKTSLKRQPKSSFTSNLPQDFVKRFFKDDEKITQVAVGMCRKDQKFFPVFIPRYYKADKPKSYKKVFEELDKECSRDQAVLEGSFINYAI